MLIGQGDIACYESALQMDASCIPARQNLGYLLFNHGRTEEAVKQYDALLKLDASPDQSPAGSQCAAGGLRFKGRRRKMAAATHQ
jgi:tetratricopeptide (TPR) repeat protein